MSLIKTNLAYDAHGQSECLDYLGDSQANNLESCSRSIIANHDCSKAIVFATDYRTLCKLPCWPASALNASC